MSLLIIFILWYCIFAKTNPEIYKKIGNMFGKIVKWLIIFSIITSIIPSIFAGSVRIIFSLLGIGFAFAPVFAIIWFVKRLQGRNKKKEDNYNYENVQRTSLTKSVPKRRKIVSRFSKKYNLNLTEKEIERIVDASYISYGWEREISDMNRNYDSLYEWYDSDANWLRAYFRIFPIQNVSSDFEMQKQMCLDVYERIFTEMPPQSYNSVDACIEAVNNRYMTAFDETTFMIVYRFLQRNGRKIELPRADVLRSESELERLMHAYDNSDYSNVKSGQKAAE